LAKVEKRHAEAYKRKLEGIELWVKNMFVWSVAMSTMTI
jgi:hypothetical protein